MIESKAYGSSLTEQSIQTDERFFIVVKNIFTRVKTPTEIADLIPDKRQAMLDYIKKNKLNGKKEADYISTVEYYNSLK